MSTSTHDTGSTGAVSGAFGGRRDVPAVAKLVGFVVALAAVFGAAMFLGGQVGPVGEPTAAGHDTDLAADHDGGHQGGAAPAVTASAVPGGLQVSEAGYTLVPTRAVVPAGERRVGFRIEGPDGGPVTDYEIEHQKELHLIAVRRDFTGFQHVHPVRAADGTWSTRLDLTGGIWRLFADFTPTPAEGDELQPLTLGTDLMVTGPTGGLAGPGPGSARVDRVDGLRVEMHGALAAGEESELRFEVTRAGRPVADLQPYLGARGHLVALREGDLAYLHVHPIDTGTDAGNAVGFAAAVPSMGGYRLYLDFRLGGEVRTAAFALPATGSGAGPATSGSDRAGAGGDHREDDDTH